MTEQNTQLSSNDANREKLIYALDVDALAKTTPYIDALSPYIGCFKIGLELMNSAGTPQAVHHIQRHGGQVFLDVKFNDIPNTIAAASRVVSGLGIKYFNVHASAGLDGIKAAADNKGSAKLLVVTILTSMDDATCERIFGTISQNKVMQFAHDAKQAGADGIICSPRELEILGAVPEFKDLLKVTPGIRPQWAEANDQKRTLTPKEAIALGASQLVVGRPISNPPRGIGSPIDAAKAILTEIAGT